MSTNKNNDENVSVTDETVTSEMGVQLTPISQIGEFNATGLVEVNTVQITPISTRDENKTDETAAMMQLLLNKFDEKFNEQSMKLNKFDVMLDKFDVKLDEQKSDSNLKYDKINNKFDEKFDEIKVEK